MRHNDNPEHDNQPDERVAPLEKLALLHLNNGGIVLYDPTDHLAWIRSDAPVQIAQML